jgi:hypothetical protein
VTAARAAHPVAPPSAMPALHRRLRVAGTLAGAGVRTALLPSEPSRRRRRAQVCTAARILTALGVRVRVVAPAVPWPRTGGRLAVSGTVGRLDELAVLTAVPRTVSGWDELAARAVHQRTATTPPPPGDVLLPVSVRYRIERGECVELLDADRVPRALADVLATAGLVVEVHLLPALDAGGRLRASA